MLHPKKVNIINIITLVMQKIIQIEQLQETISTIIISFTHECKNKVDIL